MNKKYIVKEHIENSLQGGLRVGTILNCDGYDLYLENGKRVMALDSTNGRKTFLYCEELSRVEDF